MKQISSLFIFFIILVMIAAGCSSKKENLTLESKHKPFPDYVLNSSKKVQETYIMAATYPKVVSSVPCYCGCVVEGHKSNLDCYVQKMGPNNAVEAWDQHGIACDTCINITNDTVQMYENGKSPKDIYHLILEKYGDLGEGTPTPEPK